MPRVNVIRYGGMRIELVLVTVEMARLLLQSNRVNRRLRRDVVERYARDMKAGRWYPKPLAICIDTGGNLGNGQHTLEAVILSGAPQELLIARNCSRETIAAMDRGVQRSIADIAHFLDADMNSRRAAIARVIEYGVAGGASPSFDEIYEAYKRHQPQIDAVCDLHKHRKGMTVPTLAVCARALYSCDADAVRRFLQVLATGVPESPADIAAIRFMRHEESVTGGGSSRQQKTYALAQSALRAFIERRPIQALRAATGELFPIPQKAQTADCALL